MSPLPRAPPHTPSGPPAPRLRRRCSTCAKHKFALNVPGDVPGKEVAGEARQEPGRARPHPDRSPRPARAAGERRRGVRVARRQRAKFARIGYAIRQQRRDCYPRLPIRLAGQMTSAGALGFSLFEPKRPADNLGGDVPEASPPTAPSLPADAPAAPQRSKIPTAGGALPPSRRQLEELERRDAPALFDRLTQDGSRSAVAAVQRRAWRLEERKEQALTMARVLDGTARVDPTFRGRCFASWSILSPSPTSLPSSIVCSTRAREAGDDIFSAVPLKGRWGWRRRARLFGYMGRINYEDVN